MTASTAPAAGQGLVALACGHVRVMPWAAARMAGEHGGSLQCHDCPPLRAMPWPGGRPRVTWRKIITHAELNAAQRCTVCLEPWGLATRWRCQCNASLGPLDDLLEQYEQTRGPLPGDPYDSDLWAAEMYAALCDHLNRQPKEGP